MSHIVVSLLPGRRFTVDYLSGEPRKTLERWRRESSKRLPVAAFPFSASGSFEAASAIRPGIRYDLDTAEAEWIRRCPLVAEWRRPVQGYAARYERAAEVLAQLLEAA